MTACFRECVPRLCPGEAPLTAQKLSSLLWEGAEHSNTNRGGRITKDSPDSRYFSSCCVRLFVTSQNIEASNAFSVTPWDRCFSG